MPPASENQQASAKFKALIYLKHRHKSSGYPVLKTALFDRRLLKGLRVL